MIRRGKPNADADSPWPAKQLVTLVQKYSMDLVGIELQVRQNPLD